MNAPPASPPRRCPGTPEPPSPPALSAGRQRTLRRSPAAIRGPAPAPPRPNPPAPRSTPPNLGTPARRPRLHTRRFLAPSGALLTVPVRGSAHIQAVTTAYTRPPRAAVDARTPRVHVALEREQTCDHKPQHRPTRGPTSTRTTPSVPRTRTASTLVRCAQIRLIQAHLARRAPSALTARRLVIIDAPAAPPVVGAWSVTHPHRPARPVAAPHHRAGQVRPAARIADRGCRGPPETNPSPPTPTPPPGEQCPACTDPVCLVVCLPPAAGRHLLELVAELVGRLRPHVSAPAGLLDATHFALWHRPNPTETRLLVLPAPDADLPEVTWCAGGPIGLLDLAATAAQLRACAPRDIDEWHTIVTGTEAARPWWRYLDAHHADPARYPAEQAMAEFEAQPRIAAMATAAADSHGGRFAADMYGPGLEALHTNDPNVYADYQAGLLTFADGLVTLDGQLIIPSFTPVLVEQTLAERQLFHDRAGSHVAALDPTTLLVAVRCMQ